MNRLWLWCSLYLSKGHYLIPIRPCEVTQWCKVIEIEESLSAPITLRSLYQIALCLSHALNARSRLKLLTRQFFSSNSMVLIRWRSRTAPSLNASPWVEAPLPRTTYGTPLLVRSLTRAETSSLEFGRTTYSGILNVT